MLRTLQIYYRLLKVNQLLLVPDRIYVSHYHPTVGSTGGGMSWRTPLVSVSRPRIIYKQGHCSCHLARTYDSAESTLVPINNGNGLC